MALVKNIIASETILCEPKGVDPFEVPNHIHFILSTNEPQAIFAQHDERRFAVFNVSSIQKENTAYFSTLRQWFDNGGDSALLSYLKKYDFSIVNLRKAPRTSGLVEQKLASLGLIERMIYEGLLNGEMLPGQSWNSPVSRTDFVEHLSQHRQPWERKVSADQVGRRLKRLIPGVSDYRLPGRDRERRWRMPDLDQARAKFERHFGQSINWSDLVCESQNCTAGNVVKLPAQQSN